MNNEQSKRDILKAEFKTKFPWAKDYFDALLDGLACSQEGSMDQFLISASLASRFRMVFILYMDDKRLERSIQNLLRA